MQEENSGSGNNRMLPPPCIHRYAAVGRGWKEQGMLLKDSSKLVSCIKVRTIASKRFLMHTVLFYCITTGSEKSYVVDHNHEPCGILYEVSVCCRRFVGTFLFFSSFIFRSFFLSDMEISPVDAAETSLQSEPLYHFDFRPWEV